MATFKVDCAKVGAAAAHEPHSWTKKSRQRRGLRWVRVTDTYRCRGVRALGRKSWGW
jgi:hypothetical protein